MAMTPLPAAPQRTDPANFTTKSDAFVAALPTFVTEANALETNVNAKEAAAAESASDAALAAENMVATLGAGLYKETYDGTDQYSLLSKSYTISAVGDYIEVRVKPLQSDGLDRYSFLGTRGITGSNCLGIISDKIWIRDSLGTWYNTVIYTGPEVWACSRLLRVEVAADGWAILIDGIEVSKIAGLAGNSFVIDSVGNAYGTYYWQGEIESFLINSDADGQLDSLPMSAAGSTGNATTTALVAMSDSAKTTTDIDTNLKAKVDYCHFSGTTSGIDLPMYVLDAANDYVEIEARLHRMTGYADGVGLLGSRGTDERDVFGYYSISQINLKQSAGGSYLTWTGITADLTIFHKIKLAVTADGALWELFIDDVSQGTQTKTSKLHINNIGAAYLNAYAFIDVRGLTISASAGSVAYTNLAYLPNTSGVIVYDMLATVNADSLRDTDIRIEKTADSLIKFFMKGGPRDKWLEYNLGRTTVAYDPTFENPNHNLDNWNLKQVYEATRTGLSFARGRTVVTIGSWETALLEVGAADFIGSYAHGDEVLSNAILLIDGVQSDLSVTENITCKAFTFIITSTLYRCNTQTAVATNIRRYEVDCNGITLYHDLTFSAEMQLTDGYLVMLPILRLNGTDQVTDAGMRDPAFAVEDLSVAGFDVVASAASVAKIWGSTSGISAEVEMLVYPPIATREFFFTNSAIYNKLYFDVCGNYTTSIDENWKVKAHFRIQTTN